MNRRQLLEATLACGVGQVVAPRAPLQGVLEQAQACTPDSGIVDWTPDVLHPVAAAFRDYSADQAPMPLRVFYPTHQPFGEGGATPRPLLKKCDVRWPLVLFLHGRPPCDGASPDPDYYKRWRAVPAALARSGYIVAVPSRNAQLPASQDDPAIAEALGLIDWMRDARVAHPGAPRRRFPRPALFGWENADFVDAGRTAIIGHSWGALLAARVAVARPSISSFVSLSGGFTELPNPLPLLQAIPCPKLFMWGEALAFENLDPGGVWDRLAQPKTSAAFPGEHFDYLPPLPGCNAPRGDCALIGTVAADLSALFIARHTPVGGANPGIPASLTPPNVTLTPSQQFFGGNNLNGLRSFATRAGCSMTLRWETPGDTGSRQLGPARRVRNTTRPLENVQRDNRLGERSRQ